MKEKTEKKMMSAEELKTVRAKIKAGEPTTFAERNIVKIVDKKIRNANKVK